MIDMVLNELKRIKIAHGTSNEGADTPLLILSKEYLINQGVHSDVGVRDLPEDKIVRFTDIHGNVFQTFYDPERGARYVSCKKMEMENSLFAESMRNLSVRNIYIMTNQDVENAKEAMTINEQIGCYANEKDMNLLVTKPGIGPLRSVLLKNCGDSSGRCSYKQANDNYLGILLNPDIEGLTFRGMITSKITGVRQQKSIYR